MMKSEFVKFFILLMSCFALTGSALAYVASSTNYVIQSDSLNFGGGLSSSVSYKMEDTLGEIGTGDLSDVDSLVRAGYQAMRNDSYLSLSGPAAVSLSGTIGTTGGSASGSGTWTVITDNPAGYNLSIKSATNPSLKSSTDNFADYPTTVASPGYAWSVPSSQSYFGFSAKGDDIVSSLKDNGSVCASGALQTSGACWSGLSLSDQIIANGGVNVPSGKTTQITFKAESGSTRNQAQGDYTATVTITATAL